MGPLSDHGRDPAPKHTRRSRGIRRVFMLARRSLDQRSDHLCRWWDDLSDPVDCLDAVKDKDYVQELSGKFLRVTVRGKPLAKLVANFSRKRFFNSAGSGFIRFRRRSVSQPIQD
jgi:hypothetical protein